MHLRDILALRSTPAAGIYLTLTRKCPLHCAHCSTSSTTSAEHTPTAALRELVASFTRKEHPELILLTGGEPLLRPALVSDLARRASASGTRSYVLTGLGVARGGVLPDRVRTALRDVDHVAISLDVFHAREVARDDVFAVARQLRSDGQDVSFQLTGTGPDDPWLIDAVDDVAASFDRQVPLLAARLGAVGRARAWLATLPARSPAVAPPALACPAVSWPAVAFDGTVTACTNQDVVDGRQRPPHLVLGAAVDGWPVIARRCRERPALRNLRLVGPADHCAATRPGGSSLTGCQACWACGGAAADPPPSAVAPALDAESFARRHGIARWAEAVSWGAVQCSA